MVNSGLITIGELTGFFLYTAYVGASLMNLSSWYAEMNKGIGASSRILSIINSTPNIEGNQGLTPSITDYSIKFENVSFSYPDRPEFLILDNVSFVVPEGKTVAIVGHSGSGKSTLAQLLLRYYDPQKGNIYIEDFKLSDLNPKWYRNQIIGLVSQEPVLFDYSILENIRYGRIDSTDDEVLEASKMANADEFIDEFPEGYKTNCGPRGSSLSGGQKQRVAIARALLKNPKILVLDEATSALDAKSEYMVNSALERAIKGRTTITIAHRLSTIQKADFIIVLSEGKIVEQGTFSELISLKGHFQELVSKQLSP
jgi:ATP-binding cassette subfamily B (MDR/TAP) protein 10